MKNKLSVHALRKDKHNFLPSTKQVLNHNTESFNAFLTFSHVWPKQLNKYICAPITDLSLIIKFKLQQPFKIIVLSFNQNLNILSLCFLSILRLKRTHTSCFSWPAWQYYRISVIDSLLLKSKKWLMLTNLIFFLQSHQNCTIETSPCFLKSINHCILEVLFNSLQDMGIFLYGLECPPPYNTRKIFF